MGCASMLSRLTILILAHVALLYILSLFEVHIDERVRLVNNGTAAILHDFTIHAVFSQPDVAQRATSTSPGPAIWDQADILAAYNHFVHQEYAPTARSNTSFEQSQPRSSLVLPLFPLQATQMLLNPLMQTFFAQRFGLLNGAIFWHEDVRELSNDLLRAVTWTLRCIDIKQSKEALSTQPAVIQYGISLYQLVADHNLWTIYQIHRVLYHNPSQVIPPQITNMVCRHSLTDPLRLFQNYTSNTPLRHYLEDLLINVTKLSGHTISSSVGPDDRLFMVRDSTSDTVQLVPRYGATKQKSIFHRLFNAQADDLQMNQRFQLTRGELFVVQAVESLCEVQRIRQEKTLHRLDLLAGALDRLVARVDEVLIVRMGQSNLARNGRNSSIWDGNEEMTEVKRKMRYFQTAIENTLAVCA